jgi:glycine cleavage system H protein
MITITLTLLTFLAGALADYLIGRKIGSNPKAVTAMADNTVLAAAGTTAKTDLPPIYVEGFLVPRGLRYHAGHTWAEPERSKTVRAGVDEFAARLAGRIDSIELPQPGQWVRQGQAMCTIRRNGETATLLSPVEGEVVEVNPNVRKDPSLLRSDPYGMGWLITLKCDEVSAWRNLLPVNLVEDWMKDTVSRLYAKQPSPMGAAAADHNRPMNDLLAAVPGAEWSRITEEFFLP